MYEDENWTETCRSDRICYHILIRLRPIPRIQLVGQTQSRSRLEEENCQVHQMSFRMPKIEKTEEKSRSFGPRNGDKGRRQGTLYLKDRKERQRRPGPSYSRRRRR